MGCRVGMTSDLEGRKSDWEKKYSSLANWTVLDSGLTYTQAQVREKELAEENSCDYSPGGNRVAGSVYSIYKFTF